MKAGRWAARLLAHFALLLACASSYAAVDVPAHGKRYTLGTGGSAVTVLLLRGTPYEMGYAQGSLCRKEVLHLVREVMPLMLLGMGYTPARADKVWQGYEKHMRPGYLQELQGLADGAGVSVQDVKRFHAIPDISEWHCTFFAATGAAAKGGVPVQIRALDYATEVGIQKYPALIVCKPDKGVPYVNVGWLGHCGMVTGMNADGIAMSEIGDDWDKATDSFDGRPLTYVMRDAVQFGRTLQQAVDLVKDGPRTTSLLYCLSSGKERDARVLQTSHVTCNVFAANTLPYATQPGLVYTSMGTDSKWNQKVGDWLLKQYGSLDVPTAQRLMRELHTGSLHAVVFLPASLDVWVANATTSARAYDRPYNHLNLKQALSDPFFGK